MDKKSLVGFEIKDETKGEVKAVFATLNVEDKDRDVTKPGAFTNGQPVVISAYDHKSWDGALPVGKGMIHEVGNQAVFEGKFFLNTTGGRDTFNTVKELGDQCEWSYGYNVDDSEPGTHEGKSVRILKKMTVFEVSPVLRGAGEGTRTLSAKAAAAGAEPDGSYPINVPKDVTDAVDDYNRSNGTPADKAHIIARARAIGATDKLPAGWAGGKSLNDEISFAVEAVQDAVSSASRVAALRAEKGKMLSNVNRQRLEDLNDAVEALQCLLKQEDETKNADNFHELHKLWLSSIAANLEGE